MADELSKSELMAMLDVQREAAKQMQNVANSLATISSLQEKLVSRLDSIENSLKNGLCERIATRTGEKLQQAAVDHEQTQDKILTTLKEAAVDVKEAKRNTFWLKIIIGSASLLILLSTIVLNIMDRTSKNTDDWTAIVKAIQITMQEERLAETPNE